MKIGQQIKFILINPQVNSLFSLVANGEYRNIKSNQIKFGFPLASNDMQIHSRETRPMRCAAIFIYCSARDWTRFCCVIGFANTRIHRPHVVGFVVDLLFFFSLWRADSKKHPDSLPNSPDACGREAYLNRKSFGFKNIRIRVDKSSDL